MRYLAISIRMREVAEAYFCPAVIGVEEDDELRVMRGKNPKMSVGRRRPNVSGPGIGICAVPVFAAKE